ncbi:uncharacterized protein EV422DRAFT_537062 [Fimicolochytrium jonesii]|uniref:uncharacterized protein n=1 Tax=Fimicolochytrium jonesii TaxID=1396493 RepID=UPI0022FDF663|nr:uncharacterized protein EV422DRAFT_537062 [Fimicolochytrium jonesii]KAI8818467.1 hypothetical protein EV422DRAFT_537062 [Fimicolochytrium jonesii]
MSSSSIAVAGGSGGLGGFIVDALVATGNFQVKVLTRGAAPAEPKREVEYAQVNYADHDQLVDALRGVKIVVSALNAFAVGFEQQALIAAAADAKVERFVPSEFGLPPQHGKDYGFYAGKIRAQKAIQSAGLEYVLYGVGSFTDYAFYPPFGFDFDNDAVDAPGDGDAPISWTWREDVGRFVAETVALPESRNVTLGVEGDVKSVREVAEIVGRKKGVKMTITHTPLEDLAEAAKTSDNGFVVFASELRTAFAKGDMRVPSPTKPRTFKPKTVEDWVQQNI